MGACCFLFSLALFFFPSGFPAPVWELVFSLNLFFPSGLLFVARRAYA